MISRFLSGNRSEKVVIHDMCDIKLFLYPLRFSGPSYFKEIDLKKATNEDSILYFENFRYCNVETFSFKMTAIKFQIDD